MGLHPIDAEREALLTARVFGDIAEQCPEAKGCEEPLIRGSEPRFEERQLGLSEERAIAPASWS